MPLKTDYANGDNFGATDINSTNTQVNTNTTAIGVNTTALNSLKLWSGTQSEYDAITTKDSSTLYFIKES